MMYPHYKVLLPGKRLSPHANIDEVGYMEELYLKRGGRQENAFISSICLFGTRL